MQTPTRAASVTPRIKPNRNTSRDNPWPYVELAYSKEIGLALYWLHQYFRNQAQRYELKKLSDRSWRTGKYSLQIALLHADDAMRAEVKESLEVLVRVGGLLMAFPETTVLRGAA